MLDKNRLDSARQFIWRAARVIDQRRFDFLFDGGSADHVLDALRAYRNADGGFGHGLEPDIRGPESQPIQVLRRAAHPGRDRRVQRPDAGSRVWTTWRRLPLRTVASPRSSRPALTCPMPPGCLLQKARRRDRCCPPAASPACCTSTPSRIRGSRPPLPSAGRRSAPSRRHILTK